MIRIVLADDHPIVLFGVKAVLANTLGMDPVGEASSTDDLFALLQRQSCDVLITDYSMPGGARADGLEMIERIHDEFPRTKIVVLTRISSVAMVAPILNAGASAVIEKGAAMKELLAAVHAVMLGRLYLSERLRKGARQPDSTVILSSSDRLSPKEIEVIRLFASGYSNNEIAHLLQVSPKTSSRQKRDAMRKLAARTDAELLSHAKEMGLI